MNRSSFIAARSGQSSQTILLAVSIFLSAFLLFALEPMIAKRILPWFGGSAAVWSTCLVFFQTTLLVGYLYTRLLTRYCSARLQALVHTLLLIASAFLLPIGPSERWNTGTTGDPTWPLLGLLTATIGVPFALLSATSPLLQEWATWGDKSEPYWLFAISNLASLLALLSYPLLIEPRLDAYWQSFVWSCAYVAFSLLCIAVAWRRSSREVVSNTSKIFNPIKWAEAFRWFALSACGSILLLAVTNHITENIAAVPLLWVLPLSLYLLTFVVSFGRWQFYRRSIVLRLLAMMLGLLGYAIYDIRFVEAIQISLPLFLCGLFVCCLFCHGELNRLRPEARELTSFYLVVSIGGAAGAIFVGLVAPSVFSGIYELPLALAMIASLALWLTWREGWTLRLLWAGAAICMMIVFGANVKAYQENSLSLRRSFYGSLRVVQSPHAGEQQIRTLFHGTVTHGAQFVLPPRRLRPITYYGPESGIGIALREGFAGQKRVGVIGLGTGTLAAYGKKGDKFRFYEINQQIVDVSTSLFSYVRESQASVDVVLGDARLSLKHETGPPFDLLAIDAFSGDAIPVHLLTREAVHLYLAHLKPDGVLAFHVSNDFLDLAPVVASLAKEVGYTSVLVRNRADADEEIMPADWVLVTRNSELTGNPAIGLHSLAVAEPPHLRTWTDDFSNLFDVLKSPHIN